MLLDKATGCSSNHALQQVKRLFDARKAGHTGSLDPLATGMLPICFGEATKLSHYLLDADKGYLAGARLGKTTTTADADGEILEAKPLPDDLTLDKVQQAANAFLGPIEQIPPMYSAVKIDGQRLYRLAREGKTVERKARKITIHSIKVLHLEEDLVAMDVQCSKGTYIRTLIEEIGTLLGCGAHIDSLRRTRITPFNTQPMHSYVDLEKRVAEGMSVADEHLLPLDTILSHLPRCDLSAAMAGLFAHGQAVPAMPLQGLDKPVSAEPLVVRVYGPDGLLGIGEQSAERLKPQRILNYG